MAKVVLVRHGRTRLNGESSESPDRIRGWKDVPLDSNGKKDAEKVRDELNKQYDIDCIYSSDLSRAYDTAKIVNEDLDLPITTLKELRPWNLGIYQGQATKTIIEDLNNMIRHEDVVPKDGESFKTFRERFLQCLIELIEEAIEENYQTAIFTHFRDLKCADAWVKKGCPDDLSIDIATMMKDDFKPGALLEFPIEKVNIDESDDEEE